MAAGVAKSALVDFDCESNLRWALSGGDTNGDGGDSADHASCGPRGRRALVLSPKRRKKNDTEVRDTETAEPTAFSDFRENVGLALLEFIMINGRGSRLCASGFGRKL